MMKVIANEGKKKKIKIHLCYGVLFTSVLAQHLNMFYPLHEVINTGSWMMKQSCTCTNCTVEENRCAVEKYSIPQWLVCEGREHRKETIILFCAPNPRSPFTALVFKGWSLSNGWREEFSALEITGAVES